jgi:hypothetical protein
VEDRCNLPLSAALPEPFDHHAHLSEAHRHVTTEGRVVHVEHDVGLLESDGNVDVDHGWSIGLHRPRRGEERHGCE